MVAEVSTVECAVCFKTHLETPPMRLMGHDAHDWSYYRDWYQGVYAVICKDTHNELLAPKLSKLES